MTKDIKDTLAAGPCGFKRRYKTEAEVRVAASALNLRYMKCHDCGAFHLNKGIGKRP